MGIDGLDNVISSNDIRSLSLSLCNLDSVIVINQPTVSLRISKYTNGLLTCINVAWKWRHSRIYQSV